MRRPTPTSGKWPAVSGYPVTIKATTATTSNHIDKDTTMANSQLRPRRVIPPPEADTPLTAVPIDRPPQASSCRITMPCVDAGFYSTLGSACPS